MNDVVITYDSENQKSERLKRIIRAIEEKCDGYNEIVIVGDKPEWITGIIHIGFSETESERFRLKNQYRKLKAVAFIQRVTENFLWIDADDMIPYFDASRPNRFSTNILETKPKGTDKIALTHTENLMKRRSFGLTNLYFNKHPMTLNKTRLMNTFDDIDFETAYGYCLKTLYANFNRLKPTMTTAPECFSLMDFEKPSSYEKNV